MDKLKKIGLPLVVIALIVFGILYKTGVIMTLNYSVDTINEGAVSVYYDYGKTIDTYQEYTELTSEYALTIRYEELFFVDQFLVIEVHEGKDTCKKRFRYSYEDDGVKVYIRHFSNRLACSTDANWLHLIEVERDKLNPEDVKLK